MSARFVCCLSLLGLVAGSAAVLPALADTIVVPGITTVDRAHPRPRYQQEGEAGYFTLRHGDERADNAVWTYETPVTGAAAIAGHLAFYPDQVSVEGA